MSAAKRKTKAGIKPKVLAAITAAMALYGYSADKYQVKRVVKGFDPWRKAGIMDIMLGRELNREFN
jgi:hypothetical protein